MKFLTIAFILLCTEYTYGQEKGLNEYILIRIDSYYDNTAQKNAYVIGAESGCPGAASIYSLKNYDFKKNATNTDGKFYYKVKDSLNNLYNYFLTPTEALNFLSRQGWTLLSIYTDTFSGYNNERNGGGEIIPITTVSSRPVFCFKKISN